MNFILVGSCLLTMASAIYGSNEVPVIAWGSGSKDFDFHVPAHRKLSTSEFHQNFLGRLIRNEPNAIVAFIEKSLSPEDLVFRDTDKESEYPSLRKTIEWDSSMKYLPYVSSPIKALEALDFETHELPSTESSPSLPDSSKVLFMVKLDDAHDGEGRLKLLQRHDRIIKKLCSEIEEKYEKTICLLTAKQTSWVEPEKTSPSGRKLLQTADPEKTNDARDALNLYYHETAGMVYTKDSPTLFVKKENREINLTIPTNPTMVKGPNNALLVHFQSSVSANDRVRLSFYFVLPNMTSTWQLNAVEIMYPTNSTKTKLLKATSYIGASIGNSFHTPSTVTFLDDDYVLTFRGLQAQYFGTSNPQVFGPAEDSVYFFTVPILSGLFVTSLLVAIFFIGLTMIFDVKTMDQFDDPKGKSITINASE